MLCASGNIKKSELTRSTLLQRTGRGKGIDGVGIGGIVHKGSGRHGKEEFDARGFFDSAEKGLHAVFGTATVNRGPGAKVLEADADDSVERAIDHCLDRGSDNLGPAAEACDE